MDTPSTLAEVIDAAAQRHDGASGRRLAELAQLDGFTLSHATVNRLRRGDVGKVNQATIEALAHLAGVAIEVVLEAASDAADGPSAEALAREYSRLDAELLRIVFEYARARGIELHEAREELGEIQVMAHQLKDGRPWTPPWNPGPSYSPDDQPWRESWWNERRSTRPGSRGLAGLREALNIRPAGDAAAQSGDADQPDSPADSSASARTSRAEDQKTAAVTSEALHVSRERETPPPGAEDQAGHDADAGTDPEGQAADSARPNVWRDEPSHDNPDDLRDRRSRRQRGREEPDEAWAARTRDPRFPPGDPDADGVDVPADPQGPESGA